MCGRFSSWDAEDGEGVTEVLKKSGLFSESQDSPRKVKTRGEVFPTDVVPVLTGSSGGGGAPELSGRAMRWGFPGFSDRRRPGAKPKPLINARGETALELKTWKDSALHRRCVIPTSGFYEWSHDNPRRKTKYLFTSPGSRGVLLGGVYRDFKEDDGLTFPHFSIITVAANESMRQIHDRMPLILTVPDFATWFSPSSEFESIFNRNNIQLAKEPV